MTSVEVVRRSTKHDILTEEEVSTFVMPPETLRYMELCRSKLGLEKGEMNILDWGCSRGQSAIWLRSQGYNAFGVDIDPEPVRNGKTLIASLGMPPDTTRTLLDDKGKTDFQDNFFHMVFSHAVLEHVKDLDAVTEELERVTAPGGMGFHVFPPHRGIVEQHLYIPFVHWLPKNRLRKALIFTFLLLGKEPRWQVLEDSGISQKAQAYYEYSVNKTYYRSYTGIKRTFESRGFSVDFVTIANPKLERYPHFYKLSKVQPFRWVLNWSLLNFRAVEMLTVKTEI